MALSPCQRSKLESMFTTFYDINRDGKIEWADFTEFIEKISAVNGWGETHEKRTSGLSTLKTIWEGLIKYADENFDNEVSHDEWFKMWDDVMKEATSKDKFPQWLNDYMNFMFDVTDTSGDGIVDEGEYVKAFQQYGVSDAKCKEAFQKFTNNGALKLDKKAFENLWHQYFTSSDENCLANHLFPRA
ncbi:calexcitin-1 [Lingula anatina]|uniref:Calexcitin-1 n=1 Tax=Lingula anatina TaxID=7574 RepID=A0A1S3IVQ3_LINAN|nr:calexcitin-1 [Lingula anatina]|eukprot:XP_013401624.1 calexcitin-1 [Lingula anatina]